MPTSENRREWSVSAWSVVAAFGAYFCIYAFRKPFTAGAYAETEFWGLQTKTLLVTAQVIGYTASKIVGVKIISEMPPGRRIAWLLGLIAAALATLVAFAFSSLLTKCVCLFFNGLALGMVFGLVLGFLEGRRHTEALTAGLCTSFIVAGGVTKSVGAHLLDAGASEDWMPCLAGLLFVPPVFFFTWMLSRIPPPSPADVLARSARAPMAASQRHAFFGRYAMGLSLLLLVYLMVTVLRSVRDDFAPEIWRGLGVVGDPSVFAESEIAVGLAILILSGLMVWVRDNRHAFFGALGLAVAGLVLVGASLLGSKAGVLSPFAFMAMHGLGLYLPYVMFHTTLFERLIAITRDRGTIGYLMYLADAVGYLGYAAVMVAKNVVGPVENFMDFFMPLSGFIAVSGSLIFLPCWFYFAWRLAPSPKADLAAVKA